VAGRVLLVGDAAGYVDALTGEGIALALGCARDLVQSLVDGEPESYEQRWRARTRHYRWLTDGLIAARGPLRLAGAIVPAAARLPKAFAGSVDALARPARVD
jgi:flavin-dependent dehydrogenase